MRDSSFFTGISTSTEMHLFIAFHDFEIWLDRQTRELEGFKMEQK